MIYLEKDIVMIVCSSTIKQTSIKSVNRQYSYVHSKRINVNVQIVFHSNLINNQESIGPNINRK